MIAYLVILYGHWAHSNFTKHSSLVTSLRGFETKLKFLYKDLFQDIDDHFYAKNSKLLEYKENYRHNLGGDDFALRPCTSNEVAGATLVWIAEKTLVNQNQNKVFKLRL